MNEKLKICTHLIIFIIKTEKKKNSTRTFINHSCTLLNKQDREREKKSETTKNMNKLLIIHSRLF